MTNKKILVAYFSCTKQTERLAKTIADVTKGNLYEIKPEKEYTSAELNWQDKKSRSTVEMKDKSFRPAISGSVSDMESYDIVFVGFPIWWYDAPRIISTFLESYNFDNKTIIPFATSGGSGMGDIDQNLASLCSKNVILKKGKKLSSSASKNVIENWIKELNL